MTLASYLERLKKLESKSTNGDDIDLYKVTKTSSIQNLDGILIALCTSQTRAEVLAESRNAIPRLIRIIEELVGALGKIEAESMFEDIRCRLAMEALSRVESICEEGK